MVEQLPFKETVAGSSPAEGTILVSLFKFFERIRPAAIKRLGRLFDERFVFVVYALGIPAGEYPQYPHDDKCEDKPFQFSHP